MWYTNTDTHTQTHTHTGILFSHKKEGSPATCDNTDGSQGHYGKWNDKDNILYALICGI